MTSNRGDLQFDFQSACQMIRLHFQSWVSLRGGSVEIPVNDLKADREHCPEQLIRARYVKGN